MTAWHDLFAIGFALMMISTSLPAQNSAASTSLVHTRTEFKFSV
jgi:hypothetical protein